MSDISSPRQHMEKNALVALIITVFLWASAFAGIRSGLHGYSAGALVLARFLVASVALAFYALLTRMRLPDRRDIPALFFLGFIGITVYQVGLTFGEKTVSAGTASFLVASVPCFTALFSFFFLRERIGWLGWLGVLISFLGVAIISFGGGGGFTLSPGALLVVLASFSESVYFIFQKRFLEKYTSLELTTYTMWTGTIYMLVFLPQLITQFPSAPLSATFSFIYLGIFPAAIAYVTWAFTLSRLPASLATSLLNFIPVLAILISWIWLREIPRPEEFLGGLVVLVGVLIVNTLGKRSISPRSISSPPPQKLVPEELTHP